MSSRFVPGSDPKTKFRNLHEYRIGFEYEKFKRGSLSLRGRKILAVRSVGGGGRRETYLLKKNPKSCSVKKFKEVQQ